DNVQQQVNIVSDVSMSKSAHIMNFGVDYRYLAPHHGPFDYRQFVNFISVRRALTEVAPSVSISAFDSVEVGFHNLSLYAQDNWKVHPRLSLTYGLRWEFNPPPSAHGGQPLVTLTGFPNLNAVTLAPPGTPVYETRYGNFAPRFGAAYQLIPHPGRETVIRGGAGIFYDRGIGNIGRAAASFPFLLAKPLLDRPHPS